MNRTIIRISIAVLLYQGCFSYAGESAEQGKAAPTEEQELQAMYPWYRGIDADYAHAGKKSLEKQENVLRIGLIRILLGKRRAEQDLVRPWCLYKAGLRFKKVKGVKR